MLKMEGQMMAFFSIFGVFKPDGRVGAKFASIGGGKIR